MTMLQFSVAIVSFQCGFIFRLYIGYIVIVWLQLEVVSGQSKLQLEPMPNGSDYQSMMFFASQRVFHPHWSQSQDPIISESRCFCLLLFSQEVCRHWKNYFKSPTPLHRHFKPTHLIHCAIGDVQKYKAWGATWTCYEFSMKFIVFFIIFKSYF